MISKVYEVNPLICPECGGKMGIIAFITEWSAIDKILAHLGLLEKHCHSPPKEPAPIKEFTYEPYYDDLP